MIADTTKTVSDKKGIILTEEILILYQCAAVTPFCLEYLLDMCSTKISLTHSPYDQEKTEGKAPLSVQKASLQVMSCSKDVTFPLQNQSELMCRKLECKNVISSRV